MGNLRTGDAGEQAAADHLRAAGYRIIARKYRSRTGEIDIVAADGGTVVFVEVKTRRDDSFGTPAEAVTYRKRNKLLATGLCYLKHTGADDALCRFDVVEVWLGRGAPRINHIINAFGR